MPMEEDECWVYTCQDSHVQCPNSCEYNLKCMYIIPGWTPLSGL